MRKNIYSTLVFASCFLLILSCRTVYKVEETPKRDTSLAGSIFLRFYKIVAEGVYGGNKLGNVVLNESMLDIRKVTDTEVSLYYISVWKTTKFVIDIPSIPVFGVPHNATFNSFSNDAIVTHDSIEYNSVNASVTGWVKEVMLENPITTTIPRGYRVDYSSIAYPDYTCEININCLVNGDTLAIKITRVDPCSIYERE